MPKELTAKDILDRVKEPKQPKISKLKRANIIIDRVIKEKTFRELSEDNNTTLQTSVNTIKDNKEVIEHIITKNTELKESIRDKALNKLDLHLDLLDNTALKRKKTTELSQTIKDLDNMIRLDKGEATVISQHEAKTTEQLQLESMELLEAIKGNDKLKLLKLVFNKD